LDRSISFVSMLAVGGSVWVLLVIDTTSRDDDQGAANHDDMTRHDAYQCSAYACRSLYGVTVRRSFVRRLLVRLLLKIFVQT